MENELLGKSKRLCSEALHISENQVQIELSKGSETFGKLYLTCLSEITRIVLLTHTKKKSSFCARSAMGLIFRSSCAKYAHGKFLQTPEIQLK